MVAMVAVRIRATENFNGIYGVAGMLSAETNAFMKTSIALLFCTSCGRDLNTDVQAHDVRLQS